MKRICSIYFKKIKTNAKVFYDEEARKKEWRPYSLVALMPLVFLKIAVITPLTIISFVFNYEPAMRACCILWALVLWYILAILFRNL